MLLTLALLARALAKDTHFKALIPCSALALFHTVRLG